MKIHHGHITIEFPLFVFSYGNCPDRGKKNDKMQ